LHGPITPMAMLSIALLAPQDPKPRKEPSYVEAQLGLDDVDVAELVKGLHIALPFPVSGRISFNVQLGIPLDTPRDLKAYRLRGTVHSRRLTIGGMELEELQARAAYSDGILRLEELSGRVPAEPSLGARSPRPGSFN